MRNGTNGQHSRGRQSTPLSSSKSFKPAAGLSPAGRHYATPFERAVAIARRNWVLLLVCFLVVPAAALAYSLAQTPEYTASASLLFTEKDASEFDPERAAATNLELVSLDQVATRTVEALPETGLTASEVSDSISVSSAGESDVVKVEATNVDPALAATVANEFARQFIAFRRDANRDKLLKAQGLVEARLDELTPSEWRGPEGEALKDRQRDLAINATLQTGEAQLVQPATAPTSPSTPKTTRNVALGILLGLLLGISLALLRDQFDRRLKTVDEAEDALGLSVLATIPQSSDIEAAGGVRPSGEEAEAFRMLRANLQYFSVDEELKSILLTSPAPADGKTMVAWNLALTEARSGNRILLIEADLRRPKLAERLGFSGEKGLGLVLAGSLDPKSAIETVEGVDVLPAGPLPPNPAELIDSQRMEKLLDWGEREYDRVIIDTPPAALVADALPLIRRVDRMVVVVRLRSTPLEATEQLREQLAHIGAPVIGIIINGAPPKSDDSYYRAPAISDSFAGMQEKMSASRAKQASSPTEVDAEGTQAEESSQPARQSNPGSSQRSS